MELFDNLAYEIKNKSNISQIQLIKWVTTGNRYQNLPCFEDLEIKKVSTGNRY